MSIHFFILSNGLHLQYSITPLQIQHTINSNLNVPLQANKVQVTTSIEKIKNFNDHYLFVKKIIFIKATAALLLIILSSARRLCAHRTFTIHV